MPLRVCPVRWSRLSNGVEGRVRAFARNLFAGGAMRSRALERRVQTARAAQTVALCSAPRSGSLGTGENFSSETLRSSTKHLLRTLEND